MVWHRQAYWEVVLVAKKVRESPTVGEGQRSQAKKATEVGWTPHLAETHCLLVAPTQTEQQKKHGFVRARVVEKQPDFE